MGHVIKKKSLAMAIKLLLVALLVTVVAYLISRGNFFIRSGVILAVLAGIVLKVRNIRHSRSYNDDEVGYWSGLDNFDIGIFDCFDDDTFDEPFDEGDHKTTTIY